jgi:hypothetical protein
MSEFSSEDSAVSGQTGSNSELASPGFSVEELRDEKFLTATVTRLWATRQQCSDKVKCERRCIREIDRELGQIFRRVKSITSAPGRGGRWNLWLTKHGISRSVADRAIDKFAKSREVQ